MLPMRREKGLLTEQLPDETIVYDTTNHKIHCLNTIARLVWRHCDGRTSEAEMAAILGTELGVPADETLVRVTLEQLAETGLTEVPRNSRTGVSRREAARCLARLGLGAAAALVVTIAAPSAAQAASAICSNFNAISCPLGNQCTKSGGGPGTCKRSGASCVCG